VLKPQEMRISKYSYRRVFPDSRIAAQSR